MIMERDIINDIKNNARKEVSEAFLTEVFFTLFEKLGDQGRQEYAKMIEEGADSEKLESFLKEKISDYEQVVQKIADKFEKEE